MKISQYEVEKYRREMFHALDKITSSQSIYLHRSEHFIQRLNLRSPNQIDTLRAFAFTVNRAMSLPVDVKTSIIIDGVSFLFRMDTNKMRDVKETKVLMCITVGSSDHHFSDAELKISLIRKH